MGIYSELSGIVFVKPYPDGFCFVVAFENDGKVYIEHAETGSTDKGTEKIIDYCCRNRIEQLRYDCSVFMQEGKDLRERLPNTAVRHYKPKENLINRIAAHSAFIRSNFIFDSEPTESYGRFIAIMDQFNVALTYEYRNEARLPKEAYNVAMDILTDVAKYYRRNML